MASAGQYAKQRNAERGSGKASGKEAKPVSGRTAHFSVRVTRTEFLQLPMVIRRRALRDMSEDAKLQKYYDALDCEEDP